MNFNFKSDLMPSSPTRSEDSHTSDEEQEAGPVRGRGRGRRSRGVRPYPRRGGRGRGRGRGASAYTPREDRSSIVRQRIENIRRVVGEMSSEEKTDVLIEAIEKQPSIMLDILEKKSKTQQAPEGYHPDPENPAPTWCTCGKCRQMPTDIENVCCGQIHPSCISLLPDFRFLVLDDSVLALAIMYRNDQLALAVDQDIGRSYRHAAYRQYILWSFGRLGAGNRRVIPSCCVWGIRDKFPDPFNQYTGFKSSRIA